MTTPQQQPQDRVLIRSPVKTRGELITTQENLLSALRALSGVAGRNPALPILSHVLLSLEKNQLRLATTDLEVGVTAWLSGKIHGSSSLTVPLRAFAEYVQNLPPKSLTLEITPQKLTITSEGTRAVFQGESADNFPIIPSLTEGVEIPLPLLHFREALDAVLYAAATDDTRPELLGVLLHGEGKTVTLVATDSYRLAEATVSLAQNISSTLDVIVPARAAQEFRRALDGVEEATLRVGKGQLLLRTPLLQVIARQVEGKYPDYRSILPTKSPTRATVDRIALLRAVRASAVFRQNTVSRVNLAVEERTFRVEATTPEMGETETTLVAETEGDAITLAFNERYLRDALGSLASERVAVHLGTAAQPAVFRPVKEESKSLPARASEEARVVALVMPIKI